MCIRDSTEKLLEETGATNLQDALRMVPGLTFGAGEGGNPTGDRPFIRGFDGQSNTFVDGMRDVGMQTREAVSYTHLDVYKRQLHRCVGRLQQQF